jgi:hypothetical protein
VRFCETVLRAADGLGRKAMNTIMLPAVFCHELF